jgi:hypothetical protein
MSADCEGYQLNGENFDIKYRIDGEVFWVRVSREAVDDYYSLAGGAREKFAEQQDNICRKIGVDIATRKTRGQRPATRSLVKSADFARIMKEA